jgi:uncharacterized protein
MHLHRETKIPMSDGTQLSARIWLPDGSESSPVPAVLEYIPYRKGDWYARGDSMIHPYFAQHGYAAVRVDLRGSGDSEGLLLDEYLQQEQDDACQVIAWIADQPWCSGRVGMIGFSWGGFAALQVAALRPPGLEAIIPCHSTYNRYLNDAHYLGGCVLASEMLSWSTTMAAYLALPPDPDTVGDGWREMWDQRLEAMEPPVHTWLSHQRYDDYWRHGSPCESYESIRCAVYAVGGTADPYVESVPHLLEGLRCPKKGLIGPWAHYYPFAIEPGPQIGFLHECLRWWDHWLKDVDNGIMDEPILTTWVADPTSAETKDVLWPGRWVGLTGWPPPGRSESRMVLGDGTLQQEEDAAESEFGHADSRPATDLQITGSQAAGLECGLWCPLGFPFDLPPDQNREDGLSLAFTSAPLSHGIVLLGWPTAVLSLRADRPVALVAVRLCAVSPDGRSTLISRGVLNLTHRDSHSDPSPLVPGHVYQVRVQLRATAQSVPTGHRLRLAISPTYWPWAWPSPEPVRLTVSTAQSALELPVHDGQGDVEVPPFGAPEHAPPLPTAIVTTSPSDWRITHDVVTGRHDLEIRMAPLAGDAAAGRIRLLDSGLEIEELQDDRYTILEHDPLSARVDCHRSCHMERGRWHAHIEVESSLTSDSGHFRLTHRLEATHQGTVVFSRSWDRVIPRDLL